MNKKTDDAYWAKYTSVQRFKHNVLTRYLRAWIPTLQRHSKKLVLIDTHAGRGKHENGSLGSPFAMLDAYLSHGNLIQDLECFYYFLEWDEENANELERNLDEIDKPKNVRVQIYKQADSLAILSDPKLATSAMQLSKIPAFVFIDPYTFKVPSQVVRWLCSLDKTEVLLHIIWRELHMALNNPMSVAATDAVFGEEVAQSMRDHSEHAARALLNRALRESSGARFATLCDVESVNRRIGTVLAHLCNHEKGFVKFKDAARPETVVVGGRMVCRFSDTSQNLLDLDEDDLETVLDPIVLERLPDEGARFCDLERVVVHDTEFVWRGPDVLASCKRLVKAGKMLLSEGKQVTRTGKNMHALLRRA